jgi:hypothetical protein
MHFVTKYQVSLALSGEDAYHLRYGEDRQPDSARAALGHKIGKEAIRLSIAIRGKT